MLQTVLLVFSILPSIIELVQKLETTFPDSGLGKMKASLIIETVMLAGKDINPELLQKIIDTVVRVLKTFGIMK